MPDTLYAHSRPGEPTAHWEPLHVHLQEVATRARQFGDRFGAGALARLAGLWHDLGKASEAFQRDVLGAHDDEAASDAEGDAARGGRRGVDHSTLGARVAALTLKNHPAGRLLAHVIAGHHGRLPDWDHPGPGRSLRDRLDPAAYRVHPPMPMPPGLMDPVDAAACNIGLQPTDGPTPDAFQLAMLTRMLFSALVDADRLETEKFMNPDAARSRPGPIGIDTLRDALGRYLDGLVASRPTGPSPVDAHRAAVLDRCRRRAADPPGLFSLTVPTGGGKTLASLGFALDHAAAHGLDRVVYALPFTSIIEQTADTFRRVFHDLPDHAVLEHHSNLDPDGPARRSLTAQLAAENFDSPVVVTTNVQLFESLFSSHAGTCRKLHRLAGSVIVLDEAQAIPPLLLRPVLTAIQELTRNYRCTVLLCTATQPAIHRREDFPIGLEGVREIIPDPRGLYHAMRRVEVSEVGPKTDDQLIRQLADHPQVLCIVNTRRHATQLAQSLQQHGEVLHLSALMCPQHRSERVAEIRRRLSQNQPCRVVSTQVIEAGVDVDFPVVYRALAGFDSIAQAAGRCNREGRAHRGRVVVFTPEACHRPAASMRAHVEAAAELLDRHRGDLLSLQATADYFEHAYWRHRHEGQRPWDHRDVMGCFEMQHRPVLQFREADARFRWIDSVTTPVVVPYGPLGRELVHHLLTADQPDWQLLRRAQRYSVSVYDHQLTQLRENTTVTPCFPDPRNANPTAPPAPPRFWALTNPEAYDPQLGLQLDAGGWSPDLIVI